MPELIQVTSSIAIDPSEIEESFIRASGPGGQNVNKVSSAVQVRFDLMNSPSLPEAVKKRVAAIAGSRLTKDGVLILTVNNYRSQAQNREAAQARLVQLLREGTIVQKRRVATRPTLASKRRRLEGKSVRSNIKKMRRGPSIED
ncbi:aminoacyl-tRNA hydrolase [Devosia pacifica]|uniref:Aminoacyl-tRNA hydrolase n=1 Tax=Devosia pacifica TaxID=1335967 RepID=A0A918RVB6_9HYPH|nr:alternative ribosome rescue aminoacyl-tRNA hydrolase ArfB [Devosia pacifica]GHA13933.1 aminoacyl-tRNA hydrolase [Devosia pacifica]